MVVSETMTAARMHTVGGELKLEKLPTPKPGDMDVLVRVRACGIVPWTSANGVDGFSLNAW